MNEQLWVIFPFIDYSYSIYNVELSADRFKENELGQTLTLGEFELAFTNFKKSEAKNIPFSCALGETIGLS
ncbi:MAG: hypothetical protein A4E54_01669 [Pelotomaculum sp. PtaB.Bin117]|nr:MAG: hypothetical protein A4E54_01669 [Pelotomaculum sp. PtaB.Bin117]OPY61577.1 MAG: hypothetical protein A4E56_01937 [Pelotomaculum sp. PtaU1.Bin065]